MNTVDAKNYVNTLGFKNKFYRLIWNITWVFTFRLSPTPLFFWRNWILRLFGSHISKGVKIYPTCRIWAPYNLTMEEYSCLSHYVDCYSVDKIHIGANATVSQRAFLCTASHDIAHPRMPLVTRAIYVEPSAWIAAEAFVGPGVTVGEGSVLAARSVVVKSVQPWDVMAGNPARKVAIRKLKIDK